MSSTDPPAEPAPMPHVQVTMPDGQTHRGTLYERRQVEDGWVYLIGIVLWQAIDQDHPEPGEYRAWMPADHASPLPGTDYGPVPTTYLPPVDLPPPPATTTLPTPATAWRVIQERHAYDSTTRRTTVHRADCWSISGGQELHTLAEAREAMNQPHARGCILCGTDMSLR